MPGVFSGDTRKKINYHFFCHCRSKHQCEDCRLNSRESNSKAFCMVKVLVKELEEHYLTAKADMMLAAREKPIHGETERHLG